MRNKLGILAMLLFMGQGLLAQMGVVAHLRMNGDGSDVQANHSATVNGAIPTTDRYGRDSSAYYFDGLDDYLEMSNLDALKFAEYTYSVWVRADAIPNGSYYPILSIGGANGDQGMNVANNYYGASGFTGYGWTNCSSPPAAYGASSSTIDTSWHHIIYTRKEGEARLYVNGVSTATTAVPLNCPPYYALTTQKAVVGKRFNNTKYFKGKLDELKIFNYALSPEEALTVYENSSTIGPCYLDLGTDGATTYSGDVLVSNVSVKTTASFLELIIPTDLCAVPYEPSTDLGDVGLLGLSVNLNSFGTDEESYIGLGFKQQEKDYYFELGRNSVHIYKNQELLYTANNKTQLGDRIELGLDKEEIRFYKNGLEIGEPQVLTSTDEGFFYAGLTGSAVAIDQIRIRRICEDPESDTATVGGGTYNCVDFEVGVPYYELKEELDGGYVSVIDDSLRIRFDQDYELLAGEQLSYKIYAWDRQVAHTGTIDLIRGTNWLTLPLTAASLAPNKYYILEVEGNQGIDYFLRFRIE
ncbi:sialidase domain-containing protein [Saprospira sp. CCB-QB6]|uniref:LamG-like jellyroll fold domain-containing protein n=1 Tax=Saprospira sp. CCB-QB6 TaxID=3023936 RepID=UPI00234B79FB|nr:LamG-like jellyroll fold domain-containing protein [Saprospira sp. CCB-QB6]WCL81161.1 sialidase domain-containing protein [Saprospira sp. CCB-QB6]